jgi:hypothetical protein
MALVLGAENTRTITVEIVQPLDGSKSKTHTALAEFELMPTDSWRELLQSNEPVIDTVLDKLKALPLMDDTGTSLELTDDTKKILLDCRWAHKGLIDGFMAVQSGMTAEAYKKAKLKN